MAQDLMNDPRLKMYRAFSGKMQSADMLEWRSETALGYAIRFFTRADVNHTGLVLRLNEFGGLLDRRFTIEALEHGLEFNLISKRCLGHKGKLYWYPLKPRYEPVRDKVAEWAVNMLGMRIEYDYSSLFWNAVSRVSVNAKALYCTETVQAAYTSVGIIDSNRPAMRPGDIEKLGLHLPRILVYDSNAPEITYAKGGVVNG